MAQASDDRPYIYDIQPQAGLDNPKSLPFIVIRRIMAMMDGPSTRGELAARYEHCFKMAITACVREQLISVKNGVISIETKGRPVELKYASTEAARTQQQMTKFNAIVKEITNDQSRNKQGS